MKNNRERNAAQVNFCSFHKGLADVGLTECQHPCLIDFLSEQHLSFQDAENVTFRPGGNLRQLICLIGWERWVAIRDYPEEIRRVYDRLSITHDFRESFTGQRELKGALDLGDGEEIVI